MFFNTFITAGFRPRNQNAKSIQGKFQVTTIGVVSCRTDVMPWYLDKILDSQYQFFLLDTLMNHKIDLLTRVRVCSVSFSPVDLDGSGTRGKATKPSARSLSRLLLQEQPPQWSQPGAR